MPECEQLTCMNMFDCSEIFWQNLYKITTVVILWYFDMVVRFRFTCYWKVLSKCMCHNIINKSKTSTSIVLTIKTK